MTIQKRIAALLAAMGALLTLPGCESSGTTLGAMMPSAIAASGLSDSQINQALDVYDQLAQGVLGQMAGRSRVNPYFLRRQAPPASQFETQLSHAGLNFKLFEYGRFCGPGVPGDLAAAETVGETPEAAKTRRYYNIERLRLHGEPVDRIDELCFAHDYCYEVIDRDVDACDFPMMLTLLQTAGEFEQLADAAARSNDFFGQSQNQACANLLWDMTFAFMVKPRQGGSMDLLGHGVRTYVLYRTLEGGAGDALLRDKLTNQAMFGYPGKTDVCNLPEQPGGITAASRREGFINFAKFANLAPMAEAIDPATLMAGVSTTPAATTTTSSSAGGLSQDTITRLGQVGRDLFGQMTSTASDDFGICQTPMNGDPSGCQQQDWAMVNTDWSGIRNRIRVEALGYASQIARGQQPVLNGAGVPSSGS
ncbi:MAG: hypothetical protein MI723_09400 [Caulobacterales bacterium]|nr:hypothetical protein [Caulobacterales bacterium]